MTSRRPISIREEGFTYVEMLVASVIVMASIGPALDALRRAQLAADIHASETILHYRVLGRMEDVLAEPFESLLEAAKTAGSPLVPTVYSDPAGQEDRIAVFLSFYDTGNKDLDGDFFTIADADSDSDGNPYTGDDVVIDVVWARVEIAGTPHGLVSLTRR